MEMPAIQTPTASGEMVKLIRKLRWVGLEEKAEQLRKSWSFDRPLTPCSRHKVRRTSKGREARSATFVVGATKWPFLLLRPPQRQISMERWQSAARHA